MQFIHSNKKYRERTMYPINPYMNAPAVVPLTMEAFVAPANFDPDAQELNIVKAFAAYPDVNKKYIFSVGTSTTTVLPAVTGRSYAYSENGGAYTTIISGTITWTVGSTKRNVVVIDTNSTVIAFIPNSSIWAYCSDKVYSIGASTLNPPAHSLTYIHLQNINQLSSLQLAAFWNCNLTGILNLGNNIIDIGNLAFYNCRNLIGTLTIPNSVDLNRQPYNGTFGGCSGFTSLVLGSGVTSIGYQDFVGCSGFIGVLNIPSSMVSVRGDGLSGCNFSDVTSTSTNCPVYDHCLYTISGSVVKASYNPVNYSGPLTLRPDTTVIGTQCFQKSKRTGALNLPNSLLTLEDSAFNLSQLMTGNLVIPPSVRNLGYFCFGYMTGLSGSITFPTHIDYFNGYPFAYIAPFTALNIPANYSGIYWNIEGISGNFSADSLNQSIINIASGTKTVTIGMNNKNRLLAAYPNAEVNANARGITIN